jgi:hypothetical protein
VKLSALVQQKENLRTLSINGDLLYLTNAQRAKDSGIGRLTVKLSYRIVFLRLIRGAEGSAKKYYEIHQYQLTSIIFFVKSRKVSLTIFS